MNKDSSLDTALTPAQVRSISAALDHQVLDAETLHRLADMRARAVGAARSAKPAPHRLAWQLCAAVLVVVSIGVWRSFPTPSGSSITDEAELELLLNPDVNASAIESLDSEQAELEFIGWLADEQDQSAATVHSIQ
jgi:hypothetical protein